MTKDILIYGTAFLATVLFIAVIGVYAGLEYIAGTISKNVHSVESDIRYLDSRLDTIENDIHGINLRLAPPPSLDTPGFSAANDVGVTVPNEVAGLQ